MSLTIQNQDNNDNPVIPVIAPPLEVGRRQVSVINDNHQFDRFKNFKNAIKQGFKALGLFFCRLADRIRDFFNKKTNTEPDYQNERELRNLHEGAGQTLAGIIQRELGPQIEVQAEQLSDIAGMTLPAPTVEPTPEAIKKKRWKETMSLVADRLCGERQNSLNPQVRTYLKRASNELFKLSEGDHIRVFRGERKPPIYYGTELTLDEGKTIEDVIQEAIEVCESADIPGWKQDRYEFLGEIIKNLYGVGKQTPIRPVARDYQEQAELMSREMAKSVAGKISGAHVNTKYIENAMEYLLSDRLNPPRNRDPQEELHIPYDFQGNKEVFFQHIIQEWMKHVPVTYRTNMQKSATHQFLYKTLIQLFGESSAEDRLAVQIHAKSVVKKELEQLFSSSFTDSEQSSKGIQDSFSFFNKIASTISEHLTSGKSLEPIAYVGEHLTIANQSFLSYFSDLITLNATSNRAKIDQKAIAIYNEIVQNLNGNQVLSPSQREELLVFIKTHLYQVYGEDQRAVWGQEKNLRENRLKIANSIIKPHIHRENLPRHQERIDQISRTNEFVEEMITEISKMPLGKIPEIPNLKAAPLPLFMDENWPLMVVNDPNATGVIDEKVGQAYYIDQMTDAILNEIGNVPDQATRIYVRSCLAKLFDVELPIEWSDLPKLILNQGLQYATSWGTKKAAQLIRPTFEAVVEDLSDNTSSLVSKASNQALSRIHQLEQEASAIGSSLSSNLINDRVLPGIIRRLDHAIDQRAFGARASIDVMSSEELETRREHVSNLMMQLLLPNGPQDITPFQPGNLEAIPEIARLMQLLNHLQMISGENIRQGLSFSESTTFAIDQAPGLAILRKILVNDVPDMIDVKTDKFLRYLMSLSEKKFDGLENKGVFIKEAVNAALGVYRIGGEDVHVRAYQVFLYTLLQRTIEKTLLNDLLIMTTDPRIQRQRMINFANLMINSSNEQPAEQDPSAPVPTGRSIKRTNYHRIGKQLFDLFIGHRIENKFVHHIGRKQISKTIGTMAATFINGYKVEDMVRSVFEVTVANLTSRAQPNRPAAWWNPSRPGDDVTLEALDAEFHDVAERLKDKLIQDWKSKGILYDVAVSLGVKVTSRILETDRELNGYVFELVENILLVMNKVASEDSVLTLLERTLEDLTVKPVTATSAT